MGPHKLLNNLDIEFDSGSYDGDQSEEVLPKSSNFAIVSRSPFTSDFSFPLVEVSWTTHEAGRIVFWFGKIRNDDNYISIVSITIAESVLWMGYVYFMWFIEISSVLWRYPTVVIVTERKFETNLKMCIEVTRYLLRRQLTMIILVKFEIGEFEKIYSGSLQQLP